MEWLDKIVFWHWWVLAGVLLILELTSPVFFFLWLGFAAAAVGFIILILPGTDAEQLMLHEEMKANREAKRANRQNKRGNGNFECPAPIDAEG